MSTAARIPIRKFFIGKAVANPVVYRKCEGPSIQIRQGVALHNPAVHAQTRIYVYIYEQATPGGCPARVRVAPELENVAGSPEGSSEIAPE